MNDPGWVTIATWIVDGASLLVAAAAIWVARRAEARAPTAGRLAAVAAVADQLATADSPMRRLIAKVARSAAKDTMQDLAESMGVPYRSTPPDDGGVPQALLDDLTRKVDPDSPDAPMS